jgi:carbon monoxide dehydrogenase subunit G
MTEIARTGRVDAPPATVWSVLAEFDRIVEWAPNVGHSSYLTAKQEGIGAARRAQAGSMTLVETVTMWEPERVLGYTIAGLPPVVKRVETRWELAADGEATIVTVTSNVTPGDRPPMKLAAKPVARRLGAANQTMLDGLADAAESRERS